MKRLLPILGILLLLVSCTTVTKESASNQVLAGFSERTIPLKNDLGLVKIKLPKQMDTTYQWRDYDDNECSDLYKYRFVKRGYSALAETGFLYIIQPDSVWQLTIEHSVVNCGTYYPINQRRLDGWIKKLKEKEEELTDKEWNPIWHMREVKNIHGRLFAIYAYSDTTNLVHIKNASLISAITEIDKQYVEFNFNCESSDCSDFYETSGLLWKVLKLTLLKNKKSYK